MDLRDDVLRGVRTGSLALAAVLAVFVVRRGIPERPSASPRAPEVQPQPVATPEPPPPPPKPAASAPGEVPPPPPLPGERRVKRRAASPSDSAPVISHETIAPVEDADAETLSSKSSVPTPKPSAPAPAAKISVAVAEETPATQPEPTKPEARPKRWLKAVGHFLHIHKSSQDQAFRDQ